MESKVLTPLQQKVLTTLFARDLGKQGYFLTGGTALAEFYLQHRYSDDLDFFTRKTDSLEKDFSRLSDTLVSMGLTISQRNISRDFEFARFDVHPENEKDNKLKIEFARDRAGRVAMAPPSFQGDIVVDSFEDIAVNKVCTILSRGPYEPKDFVDLYFILKTSRYTLDYLLAKAREKDAAFDSEDGRLAFATNLLGVKKLVHLPSMIKPITLEELAEYLAPLAKNLIFSLRPKS